MGKFMNGLQKPSSVSPYILSGASHWWWLLPGELFVPRGPVAEPTIGHLVRLDNRYPLQAEFIPLSRGPPTNQRRPLETRRHLYLSSLLTTI